MKYICTICGWKYDEDEGCPEGDIAPGTSWDELPDDFDCPNCWSGKENFRKAEE